MSATAHAAEPAPPSELLGRPLKGPQAFAGDWRRFWHLTFNIAKTNWRMRFFGSVLGYVWQLVRPLLLFGVLWVFFTKVSHINSGSGTGPGQPDHLYGAQLLGAVVLFTFLQESTSGAVKSVVDNEVLVRKIEFPRLVIPLALVLGSLFNLAGNLVVVFVFALISGVRPMITWLELPLIIIFVTLFASGLAMLLSSAYVYFRDMQPIWEVVMQVLFYASPVIISMVTVEKHLSGPLLRIYMLNPVAVILQQFKHAVINHSTPGAEYFIGGYGMLLVPIGIVLAIFVLGVWVFNRTAPYVADNL